MRVLLDTHALLWFVAGERTLSAAYGTGRPPTREAGPFSTTLRVLAVPSVPSV